MTGGYEERLRAQQLKDAIEVVYAISDEWYVTEFLKLFDAEELAVAQTVASGATATIIGQFDKSQCSRVPILSPDVPGSSAENVLASLQDSLAKGGYDALQVDCQLYYGNELLRGLVAAFTRHSHVIAHAILDLLRKREYPFHVYTQRGTDSECNKQLQHALYVYYNEYCIWEKEQMAVALPFRLLMRVQYDPNRDTDVITDFDPQFRSALIAEGFTLDLDDGACLTMPEDSDKKRLTLVELDEEAATMFGPALIDGKYIECCDFEDFVQKVLRALKRVLPVEW